CARVLLRYGNFDYW
nr:immunoglobulin heavy chain junction region [Mus musculus]